MPNADKHAVGSFCWVELGTTDQRGADVFYKSLFGWSVVHQPVGPGANYSTFHFSGRDVGAAFTLTPEHRARGVPPHWLIYVCVESADAAAARVGELGGQIVLAPFDLGEAGRMALLRDPVGGLFAVWQPKKYHGAGIVHELGTPVWVDLITSDQSRAANFYRELFSWKTVGRDYLNIVHKGQLIGGIPPGLPDQHAPTHWLIYFSVSDCRTAIDRVVSLGGRLLYGPMTIEGTGTFAGVADPQGAVFAVFQRS